MHYSDLFVGAEGATRLRADDLAQYNNVRQTNSVSE